MEQQHEGIFSRTVYNRSCSKRLVAIGLGLLAVLSPLYIDRTVTEPQLDDDQPTNFPSIFLLLLLLLLFLVLLLLLFLLLPIHFSPYFSSSFTRFSSYERLVAIALGLLAVVSPLYIDRKRVTEIEVEEEEPIQLSSWYLPLLLLMLILAITLLGYLDQSSTRFDPSWIYRICGSSLGIIIILLVLALILKCKASTNNWGD